MRTERKIFFVMFYLVHHSARKISLATSEKREWKSGLMKANLSAINFSWSYGWYSLFILVMCIPFQRISNPPDFVKPIRGKRDFNESNYLLEITTA